MEVLLAMTQHTAHLKAHDGTLHSDHRGIVAQFPNDRSPKPNFMFHLDLLHEWNESNTWWPLSTTISQDEAGTVVTSFCRVTPARGQEDPNKPYEDQCWVEHVVAMYADDDCLFRLVVLHNDYTAVVVNDGPMRA